MLKYFCVNTYWRDEYIEECLEEIKEGNIEKYDKEIIAGFLEMNNLGDNHHELIAEALINDFVMRPANILCLVYEILFNHKDSSIFEKTLMSLVETGKVFEALEHFEDDALFMAYCLTNILICDSDPQFESGHAATNGIVTFQNLMDDMSEKIANATAQKITELNFFEKICNSISDEVKEYDGFGQILREIVEDESMISCLTPERFIEMHDTLKLHLGEEMGEDGVTYYEELVRYLLSDHFVKLLAEEPISLNYDQAYYITISQKEINSELLDNTLCKKLNDTVEEDKWHEELCKGSKCGVLDIVTNLVNKGSKIGLKYKFVDALIKHARGLLNQEYIVGELKNSWGCLLNALTAPERKDFREKLLDLIAELNIPVLSLLVIYKDELDIAIEKADVGRKREFVNKTCKRIAGQKEEEEIKWMLELLSEKPQLLKKANKEDRTVIHDRLEDYFKSSNTETEAQDEPESEQISKEVIENVAKQLGIELVQETPENNDEPEDMEPESDSE